jgi:hypothetical protein
MLCPGFAESADAGFTAEIRNRVTKTDVTNDRERIIALLNLVDETVGVCQ